MLKPGFSRTNILTVRFKSEITGQWSKTFLIKYGDKKIIDKEYERFEKFIAPHFGMFIPHCIENLNVSSCSDKIRLIESTDHQIQSDELINAMIISDFIGSNAFLDFQIFEEWYISSHQNKSISAALNKIYELLSVWHKNSNLKSLGDWINEIEGDIPIFIKEPKNKVKNENFDKTRYFNFRNFAKNDDDIRFKEIKNCISNLQCNYSAVHGDLHIRNIFIDSQENPWLIDFEKVNNTSPTLFDFARLEINLRFWTIKFSEFVVDFFHFAYEFETKLLEYFIGLIPSMYFVKELSDRHSIPYEPLLQLAESIITIRNNAKRYINDSLFKIDYTAVLYLTGLCSYKYFANTDENPIQNSDLVLSMTMSAEDFLLSYFKINLKNNKIDLNLSRTDNVFSKSVMSFYFMAGKDISKKVKYFFEQKYAEYYLPEITSLNGIPQGEYHTLNALDHTIEVIEYIEIFLNSEAERIFGNSCYSEIFGKMKEDFFLIACLYWSALYHDSGKNKVWFNKYNKKNHSDAGKKL